MSTLATKPAAALQMLRHLRFGVVRGREYLALALFSKKRNHFLTITYNDKAGKEQAGVFELGKDIVRTTLPILEARSGKKIEYFDQETRERFVPYVIETSVGADRTTASVPMWPDAPGRFSTTTGWPYFCAMLSP